MMLSYVSGNQHLQKTNIVLALVIKKNEVSEEAEEIASSSHKQASVSLTHGVGTVKTQAQQVWNITCRYTSSALK